MGLALCGCLLLALLWFGLQGIEHKISKAQAGKGQDAKQEIGAQGKKQKTITLKGGTYTYDHDIESYLFLGTDASGAEERQGEDYTGSMADFLLLAVFDKTAERYGFLQLDRDTMCEVTMMQTDGTGYASGELQLCTAHWYGGSQEQSCENTVEAVSKLLGGIPIDGYYNLNMEDISKLNHAVGGVEVTVRGDFSKVDPSLKEGERVKLSDKQAYTYLHDRYGVGSETNQERMGRQEQYMQSLFSKMKETSKSDPDFVNEIYQELEDDAVTSLGGRDISRMMKQIMDGESLGIMRLVGQTKEGQALGDGIDHVEFYPEADSLIETMGRLYNLTKEKR